LIELVSILQAAGGVDLVSALVAGVVGVGAGVGLSYFVFYSRPRKKAEVKMATREPTGHLAVSSVSTADLDKSRREMRTMMVERDLLSSAMMKLYEAETEGRITRDEREAIARKYSEQIKSMQDKLKDVELVVEVGELEKLREELLTLFQEKIENIEARLGQAKERLGAVAPEVISPKKEGAAPVLRVDRGTELERVVDKRTRPEMSDSDRRVKEIRDEVMEALTKLEQIDIEKKPQEPN
jgi:hypothetical protein